MFRRRELWKKMLYLLGNVAGFDSSDTTELLTDTLSSLCPSRWIVGKGSEAMGNKNAVECFCCNVRRGVVSGRGVAAREWALVGATKWRLGGGVLFVVGVFVAIIRQSHNLSWWISIFQSHVTVWTEAAVLFLFLIQNQHDILLIKFASNTGSENRAITGETFYKLT